MDEVGGGGGGRTSYEVGGGRQRFTVELRPGETTIVSWKKLLKDANASTSITTATTSASTSKPNAPGPGPDPIASNNLNISGPPPSSLPSPHPSLDSRLAPGQVEENGERDVAQPSNRLNTVIERIERLYVGRASSDEEDLNDVVPDDDEYDTEDSFIDDAELDEYFQVDNSAIKHDGFFVNRGKLERVEPSMVPSEQPKKRRRKDLGKGLDGSHDGHNPSKHVKAGKKSGKPVPLVGRNTFALPTVIALPNVHGEDIEFQNQVTAVEISSKKKSHDAKTGEQSPLGVMNGDAMTLGKAIDQQMLGTHPANNQGNKMEEGCEYSDILNQRSQEKSSHSQSKYLPGKALSNAALDHPVQQKEKTGIRERPEASVVESKNSMQDMKVTHIQKKEGSSVRPKSTLLEKAIRDLQKMVAESRPPTAEVQDADNSSQGVKRRLPPEIKQKLAKVARLAQASHGKISKELVNRLMSIVGHLIQLRTLKRNLKIMVSMGISAKQEKDTRVQLVKKEVAEMIKMQIPFMKSKAAEQQAGTSDDFQEISAEEKEAFKRKYSLDDALEDKICDLYDLYIEGLEEDAGPQVRKLYAELTALWPNGFMDNHGIKRAILRAKDRRKASYSRHKDPEKIRRKMLAPKTEEVRVEVRTLAQPLYTQEKLVGDLSDHGTVFVNKLTSSNPVAGTAVRMPVSYLNGSNVDRPKQEKIKVSASNYSDSMAAEILQTQKIKRKPKIEFGDAAQFRPEKLPSVQGDDKNKSRKVQVIGSLPKPNPQLTAPSNIEQHLG